MVDLSISANSFLIGPMIGDQANPFKFNVATIIMAAKCPPSLWPYRVVMPSLTRCQYWQTASCEHPSTTWFNCGSQVSSLFVAISRLVDMPSLTRCQYYKPPPFIFLWAPKAPPGSMWRQLLWQPSVLSICVYSCEQFCKIWSANIELLETMHPSTTWFNVAPIIVAAKWTLSLWPYQDWSMCQV